ncbi:MAG: alpha-galactosidase [Caldilineaceae bacterium SB0675_bin_29]|uniref:Alpha-galactosidase n=1 Tax=Caldilineaceae bacterium SB0675_bin_29 TaxID=2605266 RepID=A0A6B1G1B1_9CHLR|nr:alpha-galactosidase [Caldilineaceae bacterium SB0675_bin_29]
MTESFADIFLSNDPDPTISYRSGLASYQESLSRGQLVGRGWNGSGYTNPEPERFDTGSHPAPQAFWVEVDGQLLRSHWEWSDFSQTEEENGLKAVLELRHAVRPVVVRVHTLLDGTPILTRWLEIENCSEQPAALSAAFPWSGVLQTCAYDIDDEASPYSVGYFIDTHWGNEGDFDWRTLPRAGYRIDGRYRRGRHRHPFFVLRNHQGGEQFVGTLAWSGGYAFEFDVDDGDSREGSRLWFRAGPDGPAPLRVIAPGETVTTPEMHLGVVIGDFDDSIQALHDHLRTSVIPPQNPEHAGLVVSGIGPEQELTPELIFSEIDACADAGAEVFLIDASWYTPPHGSWHATVGDWQVSLERFPGGLKPFRDYVHDKGMKFGLWMDGERVGPESRIAREHPEWLARPYGDEGGLGGMIDLTRPEVAEWMESEIDRLIVEHELDLFRLDYNVGNIGAGAYSEQSGFVENAYWRYYEAVYGIYGRLSARHKNVIFQNCASGGARTDGGMGRYIDHTRVTDWQIAPRAFSITNGMSMALPPERVDRLAGMGQSGQRTAELDYQFRLQLFVHPSLNWFHLKDAAPNAVQQARIGNAVRIYKEFVRPIHATSRIYHHTPVVKGFEPRGWGVLELASRDRTRAIAGLFRLGDPAAPEYLLRFRGIDPGRRYRVTFDNRSESCEVDGIALTRTGITSRLETALTSELLLVDAVD